MGSADDRNAFDGKAFARTLGTGPGVYLMLDQQDQPLYVGKAKNLRKRVSSYFDGRPKNDRIMLMLSKIARIEVGLTRTEGEALLLENEWIKSQRPRYNVLLRDDKSYPYIFINRDGQFPRVSFHRGSQRRKGRYFGPFPSAGAVRESINLIQKLFRIRNCEDSVFRHRSRPCLQYQIRRCTAPCVGYIDEEAYAVDVQYAEMFLDGKNQAVTDHLAERMQQAAADQAYEEAARYRDQIATLRQVQAQQFVAGSRGDADVIAAFIQHQIAVIQVLSIRGGRNIGQRSYYPKQAADADRTELITAFLGQYYQNKPAPPLLVLSDKPEQPELFAAVFSKRSGHKVTLRYRPRGERAAWLKSARQNAENAAKLKNAEESQYQQRLESLQEMLQLEAPPNRIECFDISHLSGKQTVGSCIVFGTEGPIKSQYRRYNVSRITPGDDYAAMRQVLERRYRKTQEADAPIPDLIIVDGGRGQLGLAVDVLNEFGLSGVPLIGVAKGPDRRAGAEEWVLPAAPFSLRPDSDSVASHLVQQIRDEAHRFAIGGHRARRQRKTGKSVLERVPGIGSKRRQQLLRHFGGLQGVQKAGVEELSRVDGINRRLAKAIYDYLHGT